MNVIYLILGGALGTLARYYLTGRVDDWYGPGALGVFAVNVIGSFLIGLFLTLATDRYLWPSELRLLIAVGFLGGFTTFSSLSWELLQQLEQKDVAAAAANVGGNVACGLGAVYAGSLFARVF
jgi:CrcB protein